MLATISTRVQKDDKLKFESLCEDLGLNVSVAINMFVKRAIRDDNIPIELTRVNNVKRNLVHKNLGMDKEEVMERGRQAWKRIREDAVKRGKDMSLDEINALIAEVRKENGYVY